MKRKFFSSRFLAVTITCLAALGILLAVLFRKNGFEWGRLVREKPSVLLILIDALRPDHLASYGYSRPTSPFLDWLSRQGVSFENVISQSSWTKTSVPSLLASLYPEAHGVRRVRDVLPKEVLLVSEVFQSKGYRTCNVQSNAWLKGVFGFNQGYDHYVYSLSLKAAGIREEALEWLDKDKKRPFFLYLHYMDTHNPYKPPPQFDVFGRERIDKYDGAILHVDSEIKRLFEELQARNLMKNTWVIVTSDHGEEFGEHGGIVHSRTLYQEVLKVPLIFYHSGFARKAKRVKRQVRLIEVAPTMLDLARLSIPESMEGVSLKKDITSAFDFPGDDLEAFSQVGLNDWARKKDLIAYTTPNLKYIYNFRNGNQQLYALRSDPKEQKNLASSRRDMAKSLKDTVTKFREIQGKKRKAVIEQRDIDEELKKQLRSLGYLR